MIEHHMMLHTKVVLFLLLLLFCQLLGYGFHIRKDVPFTDCTVYSPACRCPAYNPNCGRSSTDKVQNCSNPGTLPCDEVHALDKFVEELKLPSSTLITGDCDKMDFDDITIGCSCSDENNSPVCHVTSISTGILDLKDGRIDKDVSILTFLEKIDLSSNHLRCAIPDSLGNLKALVYLNLKNNFLKGSIPLSLGNLASLQVLTLSNNRLSGEIPRELGKLYNLITMELDENQLSGSLPLEIGNLRKLERLDLSSNKLTGPLPPTYKDLKSLIFFGVAGNSLNGSIRKFISGWTNLSSLYLMGNDFEGGLPDEIFRMKNLQSLWVSDLNNSAGFSFPKHIDMPSIYKMILRNCSLKGYIPNNIPQLYYLDLSFNQLTGEIPKAVENVTTMLLTGNMLEGPIPPLVDDNWDLSYNNFSILPSNDSRNKSHAPKPNMNYTLEARTKFCKGKSKYYSLFINCGGASLPFEGNQYDGDVSQAKFYEGPEKSKEKRWAYSCSGEFLSSYANSSDYIKNKTCGVSEESLHETARLCPVSLTYYGFCLHKGNYTVKLHFAEIVYSKDEDYSSSGKRIFDVYIQGERKLKDFSIKDKAKDPNKALIEEFVAHVDDNLLEIHFHWAGKGSMYTSPLLNGPLVSGISVTPNFTIPGGNKLSTPQIVGITVGSVLAPILLLALMWKMGWLGNRELKEIHIDVEDRRFTLKQIIDATQNFSPEMMIGRGRFGIVYKAELSDQNDLIKFAVKKISPESMQDKLKDELQGEIFFSQMKRLKHENIIQLFGGYSRKDLHLLIYEYMEKGSLHQALFDPNSKIELDWKVRFNICLGLAKALKYLHEVEEDGLKILHRNIKTSNILLDKNYIAKLTDFGWARVYSEEDPFLTIKAGGARVYVAPEYALGQPITDKADVYSFGVVALEIFSGRPGIDNQPNREAAILTDDARIAHAKGKMFGLVDRRLINYDRKKALNIMNLAILCINATADLRPTMSEVVSVLEDEKTVDQISKVGKLSNTPAAHPSSIIIMWGLLFLLHKKPTFL
ncbi:probable LRR receptor-like serine/threonine-protein kinase At1g53430 isoform X2 [Hevea brasiliensis]|uniref:probable LRR receptor-like serine/threonine-protein kinase At1g53430 isoform X2 n=1 Tax=Hevea brasiliensis TaxID=3981 RepID=UPI0025FB0745|nr:probable LRR receptor-like serine/threonine-protein kinase At1g53430 isoform X2 [Hevea brasiliensis]